MADGGTEAQSSERTVTEPPACGFILRATVIMIVSDVLGAVPQLRAVEAIPCLILKALSPPYSHIGEEETEAQERK